MSHSSYRILLRLVLSVALAMVFIWPAQPQAELRVSKPGQYSGYSQAIYDGWARASEYIAVRDGVRLAADIFRPTQKGVIENKKLPAIWAYDRYHRADVRNGNLVTQLDEEPWLKTMIRHGYVVAVVDIRGGGASFGKQNGLFTPEESYDEYDITEWLAAQSWCDGKIGMYGRSYLGTTQFIAAKSAPPHLHAIFPEMAMFDLYSFVYTGGVFRQDFAANWSSFTKRLDEAASAAVDDDKSGEMMARAIKEHAANRDLLEMFASLKYRDSRDTKTNSQPYIVCSPSSYLREINKSSIPVYHMTGWFDLWPRDPLLWFKNLTNPQKVIIGRWSHGDTSEFDLAAEHLRWYDHWLKDVDNGIMDEPAIYYYTMGARPREGWRSTSQWPLPNETPTQYYFAGGSSGGLLTTDSPNSDSGYDEFSVDYNASSGIATRWKSLFGAVVNYGDLSANDAKGATYTTAALQKDVEVTGDPLIHLWASSTAKDGDFFAYLEELDENGRSRYVTEGVLRASHRKASTPEFNNLGLPYHRSFARDMSQLPDAPVELVFALLPTSNIFRAGRRIRVTITGADKDNAQTPQLSPPPVIRIYRDAKYASYITLPVIATSSEEVAANESNPAGSNVPEGMKATVIFLALAGASGLLLIILMFRKRAQ